MYVPPPVHFNSLGEVVLGSCPNEVIIPRSYQGSLPDSVVMWEGVWWPFPSRVGVTTPLQVWLWRRVLLTLLSKRIFLFFCLRILCGILDPLFAPDRSRTDLRWFWLRMNINGLRVIGGVSKSVSFVCLSTVFHEAPKSTHKIPLYKDRGSLKVFGNPPPASSGKTHPQPSPILPPPAYFNSSPALKKNGPKQEYMG